MRNHSRVGSIRTLLEESNTVPSYDGSLGHAPQGLNPKQALALDDLMNHGISRALLQLFPSARCTLPPGLHHQEHNSGVVASTSPLRGTRHPSAISRNTQKSSGPPSKAAHTPPSSDFTHAVASVMTLPRLGLRCKGRGTSEAVRQPQASGDPGIA